MTPLLDLMEMLLCCHAVQEGVHGREKHVDDLAVVVVLGAIIFMKDDAASGRRHRDGVSTVGELASVAELAMALSVILAWGLRPLALPMLLVLLPRFVESDCFGLRELGLSVVTINARVPASAGALDEILARCFRGIRGWCGQCDRRFNLDHIFSRYSCRPTL